MPSRHHRSQVSSGQSTPANPTTMRELLRRVRDEADNSTIDTEFSSTAFPRPSKPPPSSLPQDKTRETPVQPNFVSKNDTWDQQQLGAAPYHAPAPVPAQNKSSKASRFFRGLENTAGILLTKQQSLGTSQARKLTISQPSYDVLFREQAIIANQYCSTDGRELVSIRKAQHNHRLQSQAWARENPIVDGNGQKRERILRKRDFVEPYITETIAYTGGSKRDFFEDALTGNLSRHDFAKKNRLSNFFQGPANLSAAKK